MRPGVWIGTTLLALAVGAAGCADSGTGPGDGEPGTITAEASGITGRTGCVYAVSVFDYDWQPGATEQAIAGVTDNINSDPFSLSASVYEIDQNGQLTTTVKVFDPGWYSVVFFVCPLDQPPEYFAEDRVIVDGDTTVAAPAWGDWTYNQGPSSRRPTGTSP